MWYAYYCQEKQIPEISAKNSGFFIFQTRFSLNSRAHLSANFLKIFTTSIKRIYVILCMLYSLYEVVPRWAGFGFLTTKASTGARQ